MVAVVDRLTAAIVAEVGQGGASSVRRTGVAAIRATIERRLVRRVAAGIVCRVMLQRAVVRLCVATGAACFARDGASVSRVGERQPVGDPEDLHARRSERSGDDREDSEEGDARGSRGGHLERSAQVESAATLRN